ncbi:Hypothetical protein A7982_01597 [Minicystis rosea]|nr:Hypothetical protein A7982_01597 [Minicystis rosea]
MAVPGLLRRGRGPCGHVHRAAFPGDTDGAHALARGSRAVRGRHARSRASGARASRARASRARASGAPTAACARGAAASGRAARPARAGG